MDTQKEASSTLQEYNALKKHRTSCSYNSRKLTALFAWGIVPFMTVFFYGKHLTPLKKYLKSGILDNSLRDPYVERVDMLLGLFPYLLVAVACFIGVRKIIGIRIPMEFDAKNINPRLAYMAITGLLAISVFFGIEMLFPVTWLVLNYIVLMIACYFKQEFILWLFNLGMLYFLDDVSFRSLPIALHKHSSMFGFTWHIGGYFLLLRTLSYDIDYYQHFFRPPTPRSSQSEERHLMKCKLCLNDKPCNSKRAEATLDDHKHFGPLAYAAYTLYFPTYIGGPTISFTGFMSHWVIPTRAYDQSDQIQQCLIYAAVLVFFVTCQHFFYIFAIFTYWKEDNVQIPDNLYLIFSITWLSVVMDYFIMIILWRFFRLWALLDGIEVPENLPKPVWEITGSVDMWRVWHSSYNLWLVRYIYIPFGGSRNKIRNTFLVFAFVLFTHDPKGKLLEEYSSWALSMTVLVIAEGLVTSNGARVFKMIFGNQPKLKYFLTLQLVSIGIITLIIGNALAFCFRSVELESRMLSALGRAGWKEWLMIFVWQCSNCYCAANVLYDDPDWKRIQLKHSYELKKINLPKDPDFP